MNKLQIIEDIFGENYTPYVSSSIMTKDGLFYRAYPRNYTTWMGSHELKRVIRKAEEHGAVIGVCFTQKCFDIYFTENLFL